MYTSSPPARGAPMVSRREAPLSSPRDTPLR